MLQKYYTQSSAISSLPAQASSATVLKTVAGASQSGNPEFI
jgi:hypothetical protein